MALLWRLHHDLNRFRREQVERITLRIVGWCFAVLALYIGYESDSALIRHEPPERSIPGIRRRRRLGDCHAPPRRSKAPGCCRNPKRGHEIRFQTSRFLHLPLDDPVGRLASHAVLGWWWADPVAGLLMVPIIAKEGIDGIKGKACCDECGCS